MKRRLIAAAIAAAATLALGVPAALANGPCGVNYDGNHACGINAPTTISGNIVQSNENDYYVFWAPAGTQIDPTLTYYGTRSEAELQLFDSSGSEVTNSNYSEVNNGITAPQSMPYTLTEGGVYYLVVWGSPDPDNNGSPTPTPYSLSVKTNSGSMVWPAPPPQPTPTGTPTGTPTTGGGQSAPPPAPKCVVPNLYKVTLATARYRLAAHHCRLGHVSWVSRYTGTRSFRRTVRYWPHWRIVSAALWMVGSRHPNGTKVALIGVK